METMFTCFINHDIGYFIAEIVVTIAATKIIQVPRALCRNTVTRGNRKTGQTETVKLLGK